MTYKIATDTSTAMDFTFGDSESFEHTTGIVNPASSPSIGIDLIQHKTNLVAMTCAEDDHLVYTSTDGATWTTWAVTGNNNNIQGSYQNVEPTGFSIDDDLLIALPGSTFRLDYYRKPASPKWGYVIVNEKPLANPGTTTNFSLHPSEEEPLVMRILELSGVIIENPALQQGGGQDKANTKQEQNS